MAGTLRDLGKQQYCRVPPLQGLLFMVDWGHVEGLCKSGLPTMQMKPPTWVWKYTQHGIHSKLNNLQVFTICYRKSLDLPGLSASGGAGRFFHLLMSFAPLTFPHFLIFWRVIPLIIVNFPTYSSRCATYSESCGQPWSDMSVYCKRMLPQLWAIMKLYSR